MAKRSIQTTSQSLPASSWPVTFGGTVNIIVKRGASDENRKLNSGFLRGLGYFNLKAIGNGLGAGVGVDDFAEWVAFNAILVDPAPVDLVQRHRTEKCSFSRPRHTVTTRFADSSSAKCLDTVCRVMSSSPHN